MWLKRWRCQTALISLSLFFSTQEEDAHSALLWGDKNPQIWRKIYSVFVLPQNVAGCLWWWKELGAKSSLSALVFRQHRTCDRQGPCSTFSCEGSPKPFPPELWHLWPGFWAQATLVSKEWRPFVSSSLFFRRFSSRAAPGILASLSASPSV